MQNKLYIYGDSFSTNYSTDDSHVDKEFSWPYLLRDKLELEIIDQGHAGISNQGLLQMIYRNFNPKDAHTVIIGLTFFNRTYDFYKNGGVDILHNTKEELLEKGIFEYEIDFYKKWHNKRILNGSRKWWELNRVLSSSENGNKDITHVTLDMMGKELSDSEREKFWNEVTFTDRMMWSNGAKTREMINQVNLKVVMYRLK